MHVNARPWRPELPGGLVDFKPTHRDWPVTFVKNVNFVVKFELQIPYGQVKFYQGELICTYSPGLASEGHFLSYTL